MQKAIFLDRDGVLNEDSGYVYKINDFKFVNGIIELLQYLKEKGYIFIIITNQSGIADNKYSENNMHAFNAYLQKEFKKYDIEFQKIYFCPHSKHKESNNDESINTETKIKDNCECRKPLPKMWQIAQLEFDIDMNNSWSIGDKLADCIGGKKAGTKTILIKSRYNDKDPKDVSADYFAEDISGIVNIIKE